MIIGTAGHIDHGKTTLIQALTGVSTDRLPEEKRRGITIELGFAYLPLEDGRVLGFVDVPGHEKFVHTMTAGASGIDHALLVIAADDGIMPQTLEHLTIVQFMAVPQLTVSLTKADRVSNEVLQQRQIEIQQWLAPTPYANAPIFPVAAVTGLGVKALYQHLIDLPESTQHSSTQGVRYAIDRCFVLTGSGVTVSGLLHSGSIKVGDYLTLSTNQLKVRIRSIHAQNQAAQSAHAGQRCALVLVGVEKDHIERGDWLLSAEINQPTERFDLRLQVAANTTHTLREGLEVMVHHGAARCPARLVLLDSKTLGAGQSGLVQCQLEQVLAVFWRDRIVLRDMSGQHTLAGGWVLDPEPPLRGRKKPARLAYLTALDQPDAITALSTLLQQSTVPLNLSTMSRQMNRAVTELQTHINHTIPDLITLQSSGQIWLLTKQLLTQLTEQLSTRLSAFHTQFPDESGLSIERLRRIIFPAWDAQRWQVLVNYWLENKVLVRSGSFIHLPMHNVTLSDHERVLWALLLPHLNQSMFDPPWVRDLAQVLEQPENGVRQVLVKQARLGQVHQVVRDLFYTPAQINQLADSVRELATPLLSVIVFRDRIGIGRKRAIQILEFFDKVGLTRRFVGEGHKGQKRDERVVRNAELFRSELGDAALISL
jgi:selenocysteine-specific elongation factor